MKPFTVATLLCVGLASCTSSYKGVRLQSDGAQPKKDNIEYGVPFTLTRPQFTLKQDDKSEMSVSVEYVLDPNHRYSLRANPALFADVGFKVTYGDNGAPNGLTSKTTDQIVPTVIALLKAGASISSGITAAKTGSALNINGTDFDGCLAETTNWGRASCAIGKAPQYETTETPPTSNCTSTVVADLQFLAGSFKDLDGKDKGSLRAGLYGETKRHEDCLNSASHALTAEVETKTDEMIATAKEAFRTKTFDLEKTNPKPDKEVSDAFKKISAAIEKADWEAIARMQGALNRYGLGESAVKPAEGDGKKSPPDSEKKPDSDKKKEFRPEFYEKEFVGFGDKDKDLALIDAIGEAFKQTSLSGADGEKVIAQLKASLDVAKFLAEAASIGPEQWLPRHIADLDRRETAAERSALMANPVAVSANGKTSPPQILGPSENAKVMEIRRKQAAAVDLIPEYERLLLIRDALNKLPRYGSADRQSQTTEYTLLRQEGDRIETLISTKLTAARGLAPKDDDKEKVPLEIEWVAKSCLDTVNKDGDWRYTDGLAAPKYVIALKRAGTDDYLSPEGSSCAMFYAH